MLEWGTYSSHTFQYGLPPRPIVSLTGCSNLTRLSRFAIYLRNIVPHNDVTLTEMTAKAIGQLALWEGTYPAVQFELKRATEWLGGVEQKKLAAVSAALTSSTPSPDPHPHLIHILT